jgi:hypothetical protein
VNLGILKRRWLKWTLICIGAFLFLIVAAIAFLIFTPSPPSRVEAVSDHWVIEYYDRWNPDGLNVKQLARRGTLSDKRVSGNLVEFRYVGDDCVIYSDWDSDLYGVCGEGEPVYVAFADRDNPPNLLSDTITVEERQFPVSEIKRAAQLVSEERPGGHWRAQRQAFPDSSDSQDTPHFILFHEENLRLSMRVYRVPGPVLAYRYLGHDCLLYVYSPFESRAYPIAATCGKRYETSLGRAERPSDAINDAPLINGHAMPVSDIRQRAMSERERY